MAVLLRENPNMLVKLTATSMAFSMATAKLYAYQMDVLHEFKKDMEYYEQLKLAYIESSESDELFAEMLMDVSAEVDNLMLELREDNE